MKNLSNVMSFMLGMIVAVLLAAGTSNMYEMVSTKPEVPKQVLVQSFRSMGYMEDEVKKFIDAKTKEGWIVKSVSMMEDEDRSKGIVVLEKY